jgi:hypothetical protein
MRDRLAHISGSLAIPTGAHPGSFFAQEACPSFRLREMIARKADKVAVVGDTATLSCFFRR